MWATCSPVCVSFDSRMSNIQRVPVQKHTSVLERTHATSLVKARIIIHLLHILLNTCCNRPHWPNKWLMNRWLYILCVDTYVFFLKSLTGTVVVFRLYVWKNCTAACVCVSVCRFACVGGCLLLRCSHEVVMTRDQMDRTHFEWEERSPPLSPYASLT